MENNELENALPKSLLFSPSKRSRSQFLENTNELQSIQPLSSKKKSVSFGKFQIVNQKQTNVESAYTPTQASQTFIESSDKKHLLKPSSPQNKIPTNLITPMKTKKQVVIPPKSSIKDPLETQRTVQELESIYPNYKVQKVLGDGKYGKVYSVYDSAKNRHLVVKCIQFLQNISQRLTEEEILQFGKSLFFVEIDMQKRFHNYGIAPKVLGYKISETRGYLEMEFVDGTLGSLFRSSLLTMTSEEMDEIILQIQELLEDLCRYQIEHGDLHLENIGYVDQKNMDLKSDEPTRVIQLLDFGNACCPKKPIACEPALECYQLFRSFCMKYREMYQSASNNTSKLNQQFRLLMKKFLQMKVSESTVEDLLLKIKDERQIAKTVISFVNEDMFGFMTNMINQISDQSQILLNDYSQKRRNALGASVDNYSTFSKYPPPQM